MELASASPTNSGNDCPPRSPQSRAVLSASAGAERTANLISHRRATP